MKKLFLITCIAAFLSSCTDSRYDFDNMSENVHMFNNGVYFPLLTTDIPFSRMIEGYEDNIGLQADGIYFVHSNPGIINVTGDIYNTGEVLYANSEISFSGIPDFLCDDKVNLIFENPALLARINNSGNLYPFTADLFMTPVYNDGSEGERVKIPDITVEGAGEMKIYIAPDIIERIENMGYTLVRCRDMRKLLYKIPQYINVDVEVSSPTIDKRGSVDMNISYNLDLPLSVMSGTTLTYVTSKDGLSDVFDVVAVSELNIIANCSNYYPMDFSLDATPVDIDGNPITDIDVRVEGIVKCAATNEPVEDIRPAESKIYIKLKEQTPGRITDIDGLELDLNALFPRSGSLTKWETIIIKLVADAPKGVEILTD